MTGVVQGWLTGAGREPDSLALPESARDFARQAALAVEMAREIEPELPSRAEIAALLPVLGRRRSWQSGETN
ncbi:MAG: hypothetical protein ABSD70_07855 [Terracidiphilus sp.]|jgi:hypothetical protein